MVMSVRLGGSCRYITDSINASLATVYTYYLLYVHRSVHCLMVQYVFTVCIVENELCSQIKRSIINKHRPNLAAWYSESL